MGDFFKDDFYFDQPVDDPRIFPTQAIEALKNYGLFSIAQFEPQLFETLFNIGKIDLSVGRIYEGHVNALLLIETYGTEKQKKRYFAEAANGKLFGVWNTEDPANGLIVMQDRSQENAVLLGAKVFCSGGLKVDRPIVTAKTESGVHMLVLNLDEPHDLQEDWSLWNPVGMRPSVSCKIDFKDYLISKDSILGNADDYYKEPFFSWGAVRFCAVQLGGAQRIADSMLQHLQTLNRNKDPYQRLRIGKVAILMQTGKLWLKEAAEKDKTGGGSDHMARQINFANMMRTLTLEICEEIIALADRAVGIQGLMKDHPLERPIRDLRVYLKQAGPDNALAQVGTFNDKTQGHATRKPV